MTTSMPMTCKDVAEFLMRYVDHELEPGVRQAFEAHLRDCASCVRYLEQYQRTIALMRAAGERDEARATANPPPGLMAAIREAWRREGLADAPDE